MNYLELVNRARQECGVSGSRLLTLSSASGLSAEAQRFKDWVSEAWIMIQTDFSEADFMRADFSFETAAGVQKYLPSAAGAPDVTMWKRDTMRCRRTADGFNGEQLLPFLGYDHFRDYYLYGPMRENRSRPVLFTAEPGTKAILLGATPDDVYTIEGQYFRSPVKLEEDADTPSLPNQFHMLIVHMAMAQYAAFEYAPEVAQRANDGVRFYRPRLAFDQAPRIEAGLPLA